MDLAKRIETMIAAPLDDMGFDIVRVRLSGSTNRILQIMAERRDEGAMTVEDCARISRAVSAILDVEDPVPGRYTLEVSSPGVDRPLTRLRDFERFAGFEAKLETTRLVDGRRRFRGRIAGVDGDRVRIDMDGQAVQLPFTDIERAKLTLSDELLAAVEAGRVGR